MISNDLLRSSPIQRIEVKADVIASHLIPALRYTSATYD
jgi:hypothetical protein